MSRIAASRRDSRIAIHEFGESFSSLYRQLSSMAKAFFTLFEKKRDALSFFSLLPDMRRVGSPYMARTERKTREAL
jgi:hypothetical protein